MLQITTHCFEYLFIAPYTQLFRSIKVPSSIRKYVSPSPIVCERLPLHIFELHQVNAIIEKNLSSSTVNSSGDIYMQMRAISIFIKDILSRTCEFVSQHLPVLLIIYVIFLSLMIGIHWM